MGKSTLKNAHRQDVDSSLVELAYRALDRLLVTGELLPGQFVTESEMSARLGIGRTPVREALQRLEREGLVRIVPRHGIQVTHIDVAEQLEWIEVRRELEKLTARLAARKANASQRKRMIEIAHELRASANRKDNAAFLQLDRELHDLMMESAGNAALADIMQIKQGMNRRFWYHFGRPQITLSRAARLHCKLLRAIALGDESQSLIEVDNLISDLERVAHRIAFQAGRGLKRNLKMNSK